MRKKLPVIFISILLFAASASLIILFAPSPAQAISFTPNVSLPGFRSGTTITIDENSIGRYISAIYKYAIGVVGIVATVVLMFGGITWLTAGGSSERINSARAWIGASLTGLALVLASYMIMNTVNPDLVIFKPVRPITIEMTGCCLKPRGQTACALTTEKNCASGWGGEKSICNVLGGCSNENEPVTVKMQIAEQRGCCALKTPIPNGQNCAVIPKKECGKGPYSNVWVWITCESSTTCNNCTNLGCGKN